MTGNACRDVFGWASRDPGRAMFAVRSGDAWQPEKVRRSYVLDKYASEVEALYGPHEAAK
jgi:hypothetical protein